MGLHVGLCWLMLGSCWLKVAPGWLQDGSRQVYVASSWPQDAQEGKGPQRPPKYPKMRPKLLQDGFQIDMFWLQGVFLKICFLTQVFQLVFSFSGAGKASILTNFGNNSRWIFHHFGHLGMCMPQEASRLLQDGLLEPIWNQHRPKLAPSWLKLGLCWPQFGSNLAQVGPMLAPDRSPLSQPKPFQMIDPFLPKPFKTLLKRLLPIHQAWAAVFHMWHNGYLSQGPKWLNATCMMQPNMHGTIMDGRKFCLATYDLCV